MLEFRLNVTKINKIICIKQLRNVHMDSQIKFGQNIKIAHNKTGFTQKQIANDQ